MHLAADSAATVGYRQFGTGDLPLSSPALQLPDSLCNP